MKTKFLYIYLLLIPLLTTMVLWLIEGLPKAKELTPSLYYVQLLMTALTLALIPVGLKYITHERLGSRYQRFSVVRMSVYSIISMVNILLYFACGGSLTFFYLGIIMWISMFFAFPNKNANSKTK